MSIKMIVTDLDRTLLRTDKTISQYTIDVMNQCISKGIKVIFATARPWRSALQFLNDIQADAVIVNNGAGTYINNRLMFHYGIDCKYSQAFLSSVSNDFPSTTLTIEIDNTCYTNFDMPTTGKFIKVNDFQELPNKKADMITFGLSKKEDLSIFSKYLSPELYMELVDGKLGFIMHNDATKFKAIKRLINYYNLGLNEVVSFGDDFNDLEMIKECGIGIAVENALNEVKEVSNYITCSNDDDGVAQWVEKYLTKSLTYLL